MKNPGALLSRGLFRTVCRLACALVLTARAAEGQGTASASAAERFDLSGLAKGGSEEAELRARVAAHQASVSGSGGAIMKSEWNDTRMPSRSS